MSDDMLGGQPAWTDEDQAAFNAETAEGPRDCSAWHDEHGPCARLDAHDGLRDPHASSDVEGFLVAWDATDEGAHRA